jgi:hypothetical protein
MIMSFATKNNGCATSIVSVQFFHLNKTIQSHHAIVILMEERNGINETLETAH